MKLYRVEDVTTSLKPPYQIVRQANQRGDPVVGQLVPIEDETLNTLAKLLDDGYTWAQLIPRLMDVPPTSVLYRKKYQDVHNCTGGTYCQSGDWSGRHDCRRLVGYIQVWPVSKT